MRASDLIGRTAYDRDGRPHGRIADLLARREPDGDFHIYAVLVTPRWRGRLFGYERPGIQGPWLLARLAGLLHRGTREVPWEDLHWADGGD
jgi:GNAT superfamily N-acetyltransferase